MACTQFLAFKQSPDKSDFRHANSSDQSLTVWQSVYIEKTDGERKAAQ
jgi:hypothetical protein